MSEEEQDEIRKKDFNYPLLVPFKYAASSGENEEATFITFFAPSSKVIKECAALKQAFFRASQENQGSESDDAGQEISGFDVMNFIAISSVDLPEVMEIGKKLFTAPGIAQVQGEKALKQSLLDKMDAEDLECAIGEYLVNFSLASSLKRMKEISSGGVQT